MNNLKAIIRTQLNEMGIGAYGFKSNDAPTKTYEWKMKEIKQKDFWTPLKESIKKKLKGFK